MQPAATLVEMVIVFGVPITLFCVIVRALAGDQPFSLLGRGGDLTWPHGVQEEDVPSFDLDALEGAGSEGRRPGAGQRDVPGNNQQRQAGSRIPALPLDHA